MFKASNTNNESKHEAELDNIAILKELKLFFTSNKYQGLESQDCQRYNSVLEAHNAILVYAEDKHIHKLWVNDEPLEPQSAIETLTAIIESLALHAQIYIKRTSAAGESDLSDTKEKMELNVANSSKKAQVITGYYESNDILFLRDAFLNKEGLTLDADNSILNDDYRTYLVPPFCGADGLEALNGLKEAICIALLDTGKNKQILCPYRMKGCQHWTTIFILVVENTVHFKLHDSANIYNSEEIETALQDFFQQQKEFSDFISQANRTPKLTKIDTQKRLKTIFFDEQGVRKINFENQGRSGIYAIQASTGNAYCGGYVTRLIVSLTLAPKQDVTKDAVWNCGGREDNNLRKEDAQIITEYNRSKISVFGRTGNGSGYKNTSVHFEKDAEQKRKTKETLSQIESILHRLDEKILSGMYQIISGSTLSLDDGGNIKNILVDIYKKNKEKLSENNPLSYFFDSQPVEIDENSKVDSGLLFVELFKEFRGVLSKKLETKTQVEQLKGTVLGNPLIADGLENAVNFPSQAEIQAFAKKREIPLVMPKPGATNDHESEKPQKQPEKKVENKGTPDVPGEDFGLFKTVIPVYQKNFDSSMIAGSSVEPSLVAPVVAPNVVFADRDFIMINGDARANEIIIGGGSNSQDTIMFTGTVSPGVLHIERSIIHQHVNKPMLDKAALDSKEADALRQLKAGYSTPEYTVITGIFGLPLKLEGQYINLQILCTDLKTKNSEEDKESKEFSEAKRDEKYKDIRMASVEDLFGSKRAIKAENLFKSTRELFDNKALEAVKELDELPRLLLVQGRAGIGKTTFVRYAAHQWSKGQLYTNYIWLFTLTLRKLRLFLDAQELSLSEWIRRSQFNDWSAKEFDVLWKRRIEPAINQNQVLLILDGYDEVPENHPCQSILTNLLTASGRYPNLSLLITTRPCGIQDITEKRRNLEIIGFTDENIRQYIQTYFLKTSNQKLVHTLTETLRKQPVIWANAHIPLNLNLLCGIMEEAIQKANGAGLAQGLAELSSMTRLYQVMEKKLYERAYARHDVVLPDTGRKLIRAQTNFTKYYRKERFFLAKLAFQSFESERIIVPFQAVEVSLQMYIDKEMSQKSQQQKEALGEAFFKTVCELGLIKPVLDANSLSQTQQDYEFLHLTFQEYYTAIYLAKRFSSKEAITQAFAEKIILKEKYNPRWQIVWWFVAGLLRENAPIYEVYLQQLQGQCVSQKDVLEHYQLGLLTRCVDEGFQPSNQQAIEPVLQKLQLSFFKLYQTAKNIANNNIHALRELALISSPFFSACRISPNLCMSEKQDLYALLPNSSESTDKHFLLRWIGDIRVVTPKMPSMLIQLSADMDCDARLYVSAVLGELGTATVTPEILAALKRLLEDKDRDVHRSAGQAVGKLSIVVEPKILDTLVKLLADWNGTVREYAIKAVGGLGAIAVTPETLGALTSLLGDEDYFVRRSAAEAVGNLGLAAATPKVLDMLIRLFVDKDDRVRLNATESAAKLGAPVRAHMLTTLMGLLVDEDPVVRRYTIQAVDKLGVSAEPKILDVLEELLRDKDNWVRYHAAKVLSKFSAAIVIPKILGVLTDALAKLLVHENRDVRCSAAQVVEELGVATVTPEILTALTGLLGDRDKYVRRSVVQTVEVLGTVATTPRILNGLTRLLADEDEWVRYHVTKVVNKPGIAVIRPQILSALMTQNEDPIVRSRAAQAAGNLLSTAAITLGVLDALAKLFVDKNNWVRHCAVEAVGKLGAAAVTPKVLAALAKLLVDEKGYVCCAAAETVGKLGAAAVTPEVLVGLMGLLVHESRDVRCSAAKVLSELSAAARAEVLLKLKGMLAHESSDARDVSAKAVAELSFAATAEVLDLLTEMLADGNKNVRHSAAQALGALGATATTPKIPDALTKLLSDEDSIVRSSAAKSIGNLGVAATTPRILDALTRLLADENSTVRSSVAQALGALGTVATMPKIVSALAGLLMDKDWEVRRHAEQAVDELGTAVVTPAFLGVLRRLFADRDNGGYYFAKNMVCKLGKLGVLDPLLDILSVLENDHTLPIFENCISSVFTLMPSFWVENANHPNMLAFVSHVLAAAYLNSHISCQVDFDKEGQPMGYYMRGFVEKSRYCFLIVEVQAQCLRRLSSLVIEQLSKTGRLDIADLKTSLPEWKAIVQSLLLSNRKCSMPERENVIIHLPANLRGASERKGSPILTQYQEGSRRASEARANQNYLGLGSMCRIS